MDRSQGFDNLRSYHTIVSPKKFLTYSSSATGLRTAFQSRMYGINVSKTLPFQIGSNGSLTKPRKNSGSRARMNSWTVHTLLNQRGLTKNSNIASFSSCVQVQPAVRFRTNAGSIFP